MAIKPKLNNRLGNQETLYEHIGGMETCQRLSERFHERVARDAALREIFPRNLTPTTERFTLFIAEQLGGPTDYTAKRGKQSLICRHAHLSIATAEAQAWLGHMFVALDEVGITAPALQRLRDYFTETAHTLTDPLLPFYRLPLDELRALLEQNPAPATASEMGHTLLGEAVCRWDLPRVRLLLEFGANVNTESLLGHDPLYHATNASAPGSEAEGRGVVELLLRYGADVNRPSGPGQSTPLHMTARRDHVTLAEVLLDAGADMEKKDSKGETPLRRAVNCGKEGMVVFLLSRGADPLSQDKQGRTVFSVARQERIRKALSQYLK